MLAQSIGLRRIDGLILNEPQLKQWAKDFYYYVEPAIPTIAAWLSMTPTLPDRDTYKLIARNLAGQSGDRQGLLVELPAGLRPLIDQEHLRPGPRRSRGGVEPAGAAA